MRLQTAALSAIVTPSVGLADKLPALHPADVHCRKDHNRLAPVSSSRGVESSPDPSSHKPLQGQGRSGLRERHGGPCRTGAAGAGRAGSHQLRPGVECQHAASWRTKAGDLSMAVHPGGHVYAQVRANDTAIYNGYCSVAILVIVPP